MSKSFRKRFVFWLNLHKPDESIIAEQIDSLKDNRSFARAIRDGLRLFVSLSKGETTVLEELFPHIVAKLRGDAPDDRAGGLSEEKLREIILEATQVNSLNHIKQPMSHIPMSKPLILDDDIPKVEVIKSDKSSNTDGTNVAQNFLNGLTALMNG